MLCIFLTCNCFVLNIIYANNDTKQDESNTELKDKIEMKIYFHLVTSNLQHYTRLIVTNRTLVLTPPPPPSPNIIPDELLVNKQN